ncbi:ATP-dependent acyl-CoA ligase [Nocardioides endophyticus]|uniref:ATP-dependent acyl-CoA ligase n=1 Tax=Nocardioides endophyticus TaxID=1353775 RepID=A0ABP8Y8P8_9ACTN
MNSHDIPFAHLWSRTVDRDGTRPFLLFRSDDGVTTQWTYAEFDRVVAQVAGSLRARGVGHGTPVHVVLRNAPIFVATWLAVARLGAWMVPVDPASTARDVASQVRRIRPQVALVAASRAAAFREGASGAVPCVVELNEDASDLDPQAEILSSPPVTGAPVSPGDRLAVMFTSGTTSEPKGVDLTQACYTTVSLAMAQAAHLAARHRWFVSLPLFHANAQYYCFGPAIAVGASVALVASFSASRWVAQARDLEVTHASLFASPIRMILARTPSDIAPLALEHIWFAQSLGREHHELFGSLAGRLPRQLYGMTETCAIVTADASEPPVHNVIGPAANRRICVVDPSTGHEVFPGEVGELWVHGQPGRDLFAGYLDAPEINARALTAHDGGYWFHTGDLVVRDAEGVCTFVGRMDDVIKVSGENVSLTETEAALAQAPGVLEVAVVAQPDPVRDQVPVAFIVAHDRANPPDMDELEAWAAENLAPAARPRAWNLIDELPRTSVGKVRRFQIPR